MWFYSSVSFLKSLSCRLYVHLIVAVLLCSNWACSRHSLVGSTMTDYTVNHLAPYLLSSDDMRMACELGVSMGPYLLSFERVMKAPDEAGIPTLVTAALCAELRVWEQDLRATRAFKQQQVSEYKDALISQKRAHSDAARRYYQAYVRMQRHYGETCVEDASRHDELAMLLGFVAGIQAVQHDRAAQVAIGVPADIPRKVSRQSKCLDTKKWWGVPKALRAAVWLVVPNSAPFKADTEETKRRAYQVLTAQMEIGRKAGVRLVDSIFAYAAHAIGDQEQVKKIIQGHADSLKNKASHKKWQLLDLTSTLQLEALSDKLWTQAKGHRTPHGELGTFWEEEKVTDSEEGDDDLLEDLEDN